ncbi:MAG: VOC family protein [Sphingobium sp.]
MVTTSPNTPVVGAVQAVTMGVSDLDFNLRLYRDAMKMVEESRHALSDSLRRAWQLPEGVTGELVELSCAGYPMGRVRLAHFEGLEQVLVRSHTKDSALDVGPKAIDFYVRDPITHAMAIYGELGLKARAAPVTHTLGTFVSEELTYIGPDQCSILLMVGHVHAPTDLRPSWTEGDFSEVATLSIVSSDLGETRRFYADMLGLEESAQLQTGPEDQAGVATLTGTPGGEVNWKIFKGQDEPSGKILVLNFSAPGRRLTDRMKPGNLGFSMMTHMVSDIGALHERLEADGYIIVTPPAEVDVAGDARRIMLVKGPNEEMLEFVER